MEVHIREEVIFITLEDIDDRREHWLKRLMRLAKQKNKKIAVRCKRGGMEALLIKMWKEI